MHERKGAYIRDGKLILRLNRRIELDILERALRWLEKRLAEKPDKRYVRVFERSGKLAVQIVLHKVNVVEMPEDPLLIVVDVSSSYGIAVHFWNEKLIKTLKLRPPNKGNGWRNVRGLMSHRDLLHGQGCLSQKQINTYSALIRLALKGSMKGWVRRSVAKIVKRVRRIAKRHGRGPLVVVDNPEYDSIHGTPLQRTLYSFVEHLENVLSWYGICWVEKRLYQQYMPILWKRADNCREKKEG